MMRRVPLSFIGTLQLKTAKGLALVDLLHEFHAYLMLVRLPRPV
jgi:hypothetical protein